MAACTVADIWGERTSYSPGLARTRRPAYWDPVSKQPSFKSGVGSLVRVTEGGA
ncbi:MAG TPA: hypothetical protein VJW23_07720 [Propionibacteriaceae bacterium]|nr:hypothetical protein [Propionibacteriaceae bacterium]